MACPCCARSLELVVSLTTPGVNSSVSLSGCWPFCRDSRVMPLCGLSVAISVSGSQLQVCPAGPSRSQSAASSSRWVISSKCSARNGKRVSQNASAPFRVS